MTTAYNITFGELAENKDHVERLEKMMKEVQALAEKFNVRLTGKDIENSLAMLLNFPYESKTSLQLDFENRNQGTGKTGLVDFENQNHETEKDVLVSFVIKNGKELGVNVSNYEEIDKIIKTSYIVTLP